jgi:hypothetical protein
VTLVTGQTFYESLQDVHVVGRNASKKTSSFSMFIAPSGRKRLPFFYKEHLNVSQDHGCL